jgi:antitoxin FitA
MSNTCDNVQNMSKMIQIRNVPDELHRQLKIKAAERGISLSDLLLQMAEREVNRVSWEEMSERIRSRGRVELTTPAADVIREMRGPIGPATE